jgi:arsenite/tail-anchored protein-transporting ATPase
MSTDLTAFFAEHPDLRFVFTGGKGGVGKTVSAAAIAMLTARQGRRTLVASLNPVHSLASLFGQRGLASGRIEAVQGVPNLDAIEVEADEIVARYRTNIGGRVREFLKWADIPVDARPFVDIAVTNPAFEESAMFDKMMDVMLTEGRDYERIVFDTAAVANAVRLIGLSKIYGLWLQRMIDSRKEALGMRVQLAFRKEKVMDEVAKDPLMADLLDMNERFTQVKALLTDPQKTAFFFVTLPLSLPISVVKRFISMVEAYDIPMGGVIVNQVLQPELLAAGAPAGGALGGATTSVGGPGAGIQSDASEYVRNRYEEQLGYLDQIRADLGPHVRAFIPQYPDEVHSVAGVEQVAQDLFAFIPESWSATAAGAGRSA